MKTLISLLITTFAFNAFAVDLGDDLAFQISELTKFEMGSGYNNGMLILSGQLEFGKDKAYLTIKGTDRMDPSDSKYILKEVIPVVSVTKDGCGSQVITAISDKSPADGLRTVMTVLDHRTRLCDDYRPYATEINLAQTSPWTRETAKSYFGGEAIAPVRFDIQPVVLLDYDLAFHSSSLVDIEMDSELIKEKYNFAGSIDLESKDMHLLVYGFDPANPHDVVFEMGHTLKITKLTTDCGSRVIKGILDQRPVDGHLIEVTVWDHRTRQCRDVVRNKTEVLLKMTAPRTQKIYHSYLGGTALFPNIHAQ